MTSEPPPAEDREPTPEEMAAAFAYRLGRTPVRDVLLQTMATFADMAGIRLGLGPEGDGPKDLEQARQAIEGLRAMHAVAEEQLGVAQTRPFKEPLAALQLRYAHAVEEQSAKSASAEGEEGAGKSRSDAPVPPASGDATREPGGGEAASRLWVPPGTRR